MDRRATSGTSIGTDSYCDGLIMNRKGETEIKTSTYMNELAWQLTRLTA